MKQVRSIFSFAMIIMMSYATLTCNLNSTDKKKVIYQPTWESLANHNTQPEWFKDTKFGIYFHWGPNCVPEYSSEWYPRWMYFKDRGNKWGGEVYPFHKENYGEPEDFNYHDFFPMFKAEHFNAAEWVALFKASGATFAGPVAQHHDGFAMWDSDVNPNNAMDKGPHKDILGDLFAELKKQDMKTIATFHHARNLQRYANDTSNWAGHGPDIAWDSHYPYHPDYATSTTDSQLKYLYGNIPADEFHEYWLNQVNEVVDKYAPDMIWFDSWLDLIPENYRQKMVAHHYNTAVARGQEPVVFYKQEDLPDSVALTDIEQGGKTDISDKYWLTDITISFGSWCYTNEQEYKEPTMVIRNMIDVWSKNGVVLLNVSPRADGTIPKEQQKVLITIGEWIKKHEEAVYNTRAHSVFGYGIAGFEAGHFGGQSATMKYTKDDVRFAKSKDGSTLYVYVLGLPDENKELELEHIFDSNPAQQISTVSIVGSKTRLDWKVKEGKLAVKTPVNSEMDELATVIKVEFE
jgi:alpha-L-fucosidase